MEKEWLIWSNEHNGWSGPDSHGYTKSRQDAGRYSFSEAAAICEGANEHRKDYESPFETMIPDNQ